MFTSSQFVVANIYPKTALISTKTNSQQNVVIAQINYFSKYFFLGKIILGKHTLGKLILGRLTLEKLPRVLQITIFLSKSKIRLNTTKLDKKDHKYKMDQKKLKKKY